MEEYLEDTLFVWGLPDRTTEATLIGCFRKYGYVSGATVLRDHLTGNSLGIGFVCFCHPSSFDRALQESHPHFIFGKEVNVTRAIVGQLPQWLSTSSNSGYINGTIFVDGVGSKWSPYNLTRWQLESYFQKFGRLTYVGVPTDRFGHYRGFALITFAPACAAEEVSRRRFHVINGKAVEVRRAVQGEMGESNYGRDRGHHHPGGSSSRRSDYIGGPATDNGVAQPSGFGSFTSGTGVYGNQILQGGYACFPSGIPQNFPQVSLGPVGTRTNVPVVSTYIYGNFSYHANMSSDGGLGEATGLQSMHNPEPPPYNINSGGILQCGYTGTSSGNPSKFSHALIEPSGSPWTVPPQVLTYRYGYPPNVPHQVLMDPSGNPRNVPHQVLMDPSGNPRNVPQVSAYPYGNPENVPQVPTYSYANPYYPANMSRDGGQRGATGLQNVHNQVPEPTMNELGFVSENALADVDSSRDEYETPDFDGTAGQGFS